MKAVAESVVGAGMLQPELGPFGATLDEPLAPPTATLPLAPALPLAPPPDIPPAPLEPPVDEVPAIEDVPATPAPATPLFAPLLPGAPAESVGVTLGPGALLQALTTPNAESSTLASCRYFIPGSCPGPAQSRSQVELRNHSSRTFTHTFALPFAPRQHVRSNFRLLLLLLVHRARARSSAARVHVGAGAAGTAIVAAIWRRTGVARVRRGVRGFTRARAGGDIGPGVGW